MARAQRATRDYVEAVANILYGHLAYDVEPLTFADAEQINAGDGWTTEFSDALNGRLRVEGFHLTGDGLRRAWETAETWLHENEESK